jgi:hypothetical protein
MTASMQVSAALFPGRFASLRQLFELVSQIGRLSEPITSAAGLRKAIEIVVSLARLVGIDAALVDRLQAALDNEAVFGVVLALVRLAEHAVASGEFDDRGLDFGPADTDVVLTSQAIVDWLPIVLELIALLRALRGQS